MSDEPLDKTNLKQCVGSLGCGRWLDKSNFQRHNQHKDGLGSHCKDCLSKQNKKRYREKREAKVQYQREWRARNPNYHREWYLKHPNYYREWEAEFQRQLKAT